MKTYNLTKEDSNVIQISRGLFILFVVMIHASSGRVSQDVIGEYPAWLHFMQSALSDVILLSGLYGFFVISSILLFRREVIWKENIKKKTKSILIPYLFVNTLWILIFFLVGKVPALQSVFSAPQWNVSSWSITQWLDAYLGFGDTGMPIVYPLWYLRDLFVLNLIYPVLKKCIEKVPIVTIIALVIIVFAQLPMPFFLNRDALVAFTVGGLLVNYQIHFSDIKKIPFILILLLYVVCIGITVFMNGSNWMFIPQDIAFVIGVIFWIRFIQICIDQKMNHKVLLLLSKYSMSIFLFHEIALTVIKRIISIVLPSSIIGVIASYMISGCIIIVMIILMSSILNKITPKFYRFVTGGR